MAASFSLYLRPTNPLVGPISKYRIQGQGVNMRFGDPVHPLTHLAVLQFTKSNKTARQRGGKAAAAGVEHLHRREEKVRTCVALMTGVVGAAVKWV